MSILSYLELVEIAAMGVVQGLEASQINAASIDVRLGHSFMFEKKPAPGKLSVSIASREAPNMERKEYALGSAPFLDPGEFCLACTLETFNLPDDISAEFKLKSSVARAGLNQLTAVWADAGWHGSVLTLELQNVLRHHRLELEVGMPIGQMVFHRHTIVPKHASYSTRGRYNGDKKVQGVKL